MPYLGLFFDAMFAVKNLTNFVPAITCPTSANEPSVDGSKVEVGQLITGIKYGELFNAIYGVKKLANFIPAITCPTSANKLL